MSALFDASALFIHRRANHGELHSAPIIDSRVDKYGRKVWEDLEKVVEERLKAEALKQPEARAGEGAATGKGETKIEVPDDVYA